MSNVPYPVGLYPGCPCWKCDSPTWEKRHGCLVLPQRMSLCPTCGNKRCPGAVDHNLHGVGS